MQSRKIRWIIQIEENPWQGESVEKQISCIKGNINLKIDKIYIIYIYVYIYIYKNTFDIN